MGCRPRGGTAEDQSGPSRSSARTHAVSVCWSSQLSRRVWSIWPGQVKDSSPTPASQAAEDTDVASRSPVPSALRREGLAATVTTTANRSLSSVDSLRTDGSSRPIQPCSTAPSADVPTSSASAAPRRPRRGRTTEGCQQVSVYCAAGGGTCAAGACAPTRLVVSICPDASLLSSDRVARPPRASSAVRTATGQHSHTAPNSRESTRRVGRARDIFRPCHTPAGTTQVASASKGGRSSGSGLLGLLGHVDRTCWRNRRTRKTRRSPCRGCAPRP